MATVFIETNPRVKFAFTASEDINNKELSQRYLPAFLKAQNLVEMYNLKRIATLPDTILLQNDPDFSAILNKIMLDTASVQYYGKWERNKFIVAHCAEFLQKEHLEHLWPKNEYCSFKPLTDDFFRQLVKTNSVPVYTFSEMRKGAIKDRTQPRIIIAEVNKEKDFEILPSFEPIPIEVVKKYGIFQMLAGGPEDANELAKYYQEKGIEKICVEHRLDVMGFDEKLWRPLSRSAKRGIYSSFVTIDGVFCAVDVERAFAKKNADLEKIDTHSGTSINIDRVPYSKQGNIYISQLPLTVKNK